MDTTKVVKMLESIKAIVDEWAQLRMTSDEAARRISQVLSEE